MKEVRLVGDIGSLGLQHGNEITVDISWRVKVELELNIKG